MARNTNTTAVSPQQRNHHSRELIERLQPWKALRVVVDHAEVNFDLAELLAERVERNWTYFGRLGLDSGRRNFEIRRMS